MKTNKNFILREIAGESLLVPSGNHASDFNGMITLNEMAVFMWKHIDECQDEEDLVNKVLSVYTGDIQLIRNDVHIFIDGLLQLGMIEE